MIYHLYSVVKQPGIFNKLLIADSGTHQACGPEFFLSSVPHRSLAYFGTIEIQTSMSASLPECLIEL